MICEMCAHRAKVNRYKLDVGYEARLFKEHPKNCGCPCQHKMPTQWEDSFSVPRPGVDSE